MLSLSFNAGDKLADFYLRRDGIDVDDIVGADFWGIETGSEGEVDMQAVGTAAGKLNHWQRSAGEEQGRVVDADGAVFVHEMVFIEAREVVGLVMPFSWASLVRPCCRMEP